MEAIVDNIIVYVAGILLILSLVLGFTTYTYYNKNFALKAEVVTLTEKLRISEANLGLAEKSCTATTKVTDEVSSKIEDKQEKMTSTLVELVKLPPAKEPTNGTKKYADDDSLSPDLMGLLDKAYCDAQPADPTCTASRATKTVPSKEGGK